jgi:hypothetical protein
MVLLALSVPCIAQENTFMAGVLEGQYLASLAAQAASGNATAAYTYNAEVIRLNQNSTVKLQPIAIPAIPNPAKQPMKGHYAAADGTPTAQMNALAQMDAANDMQQAFLKS